MRLFEAARALEHTGADDRVQEADAAWRQLANAAGEATAALRRMNANDAGEPRVGAR